jgi:GTP cyclohydrolase I
LVHEAGDGQPDLAVISAVPQGLEDPLRINRKLAENSIRQVLWCLGQDALRQGLRETPARVYSALQEMTQGYAQDPVEILSKQFEEPTDEIVVLKGVEFHSLCEHHLLPFFGTVALAYLPREKVVGLSKMARLVDCFARRLQVQERMTTEIADAMSHNLRARGVAVIVRAQHLCMCVRGVKKPGAEMIVSVMRGVFRENAAARAEVMELLR